jgi:parvulin-like peptidyl-prolyl isomerase
MRCLRYFPVLLLALAFVGCGDKEPAPFVPADHISVDHILIAVRSPEMLRARHSDTEARALAYELFDQLKAGADWAALKKEHSEDPPPGGPYAMANHGVPVSQPGERPRRGMVPAFGDVGFSLRVGEIGISDYDARKSPFGYHIIKRVK